MIFFIAEYVKIDSKNYQKYSLDIEKIINSKESKKLELVGRFYNYY